MKISTSPNNLEELRVHFNSLPMEKRVDFIGNLTPKLYRYLKYFTDVFYWDKQVIPQDGWLYYLLLGGRGSGKSETLWHEIAKRLMRGDPGLMAVSASYDDMHDVLVPSVLSQFPEDSPAVFNFQKKIITAPNGNSISLKSAEKGIIKGRNITTCFIDELSECWSSSDLEKQLNYFRILDGNIRKGNAQIIAASNPETSPIFRHWADMHADNPKQVRIIESSIYDNPYLDPIKKAAYIKQWKGTRYERMQLLGKMDWSADGALWTQEMINNTRVFSKKPDANLTDHVEAINKNGYGHFKNPFHFFTQFAIAVDPAMSVSERSDETGIMIGALGMDGHVYILEDLSNKLVPDDIAGTIQKAFDRYGNMPVIVEVNQGGMFVSDCLKTRFRNVDALIKDVHVSQGKLTRAQPATILWDKKQCHIVGFMPKLERQMIYYTGDASQKSPDRFNSLAFLCKY